MPNHITNELTVDAGKDERLRIFEAIKDDRWGLGSIDVNKLIPMPKELDVTESVKSYRAVKMYREFIGTGILQPDDLSSEAVVI